MSLKKASFLNKDKKYTLAPSSLNPLAVLDEALSIPPMARHGAIISILFACLFI